MGGFAGLIEQVKQRRILPNIARIAQRSREAGLPVIHLTIAHRPDFIDVQPNSLLAVMARKNRLLIAGSPEAEIVKDLTPAPQDLLVARSSGLIGFHGTALDAMLRRMRIETIVIAGVSTNVAVAGCAMAGADLGYHVIIAEDCVAAADPVTHEVIIKDQLRMIAHVASADDVEQALQGSGPY
jgi:nicotinamidase-related amidase